MNTVLYYSARTIFYLIVIFIVCQLFRLPFDLASHDFSRMQTFDAKDLQAGDIVLLRWDNWYYTKCISWFTHVMQVIDVDGTLYTAEIRSDPQLDVLDGTMRQMCIRDPQIAITTYGGTYAVRRRIVSLTETQSKALTNAVMSYRNDTYTTDLLGTYLGSFTPFSWKYKNKGKAWCSQVVGDWLKKAKISNMIHPIWVWPSDFTSKWTPFGFTRKYQQEWTEEQIPVWNT